ncbi:MAG TPA: hypothetical protein VFV89_09640 [Nocardioides sp.]|uniref:hypothetical protein n=1 Tax=Nocardioides sp. TaxID=35761 RepID=UPI002E369F24|nr:hypothetical protein [Nocardioides sp.]HEX5088060.1 hypothetical protein [Nocardioides sp.]
MSWEQELFGYLDDLEGRAEALYDAERGPEIAERGRAEYRSVTLAARLMASLDHELIMELAGVGPVSGRLARVANGWCLLEGPGQEWVVRFDAVAAVHGTSDRAVPELAWPAVAGLSLAAALRRVADSAEPCSIHLSSGGRHDGALRRVGADFLEVATGETGRVVLVAFGRLAAVQARHAIEPSG